MQFALNSTWRVTAWDKTLELVSGFVRDEILGVDFLEDLVAYEDQDDVLEVLLRAYHDQQDVHNFCTTFYSRCGTPIKLLYDVFPIFDVAKSISGVSIIAKRATHITQIKANDTAHFALDSEWHITAWNVAMERLFRLKRCDVLGRNFGDFVVEDDKDGLKDVLEVVFQRRTDVNKFEFALYSWNGLPRKLVLNISPYFNKGNKNSAAGFLFNACHVPQIEKCSAYLDHVVGEV